MRILIMTDAPNLPTGQARVGREIATGLKRHGHDVGYLGWFQVPEIAATAPAGIHYWWTNNSYYGQDILDRIVQTFQPDVVLTIGDFWNLNYIADPNICRTRRRFQWCSYIPVDGEPINGGLPPSIRPIIEDIDIPVAYTNYAKDAVLKSIFDQETRNRLRVIYHGVDTKTFKPDPSNRVKIREQYGMEDKFVFLSVSRNQSRKNIPELFRAWKIFSELPEVRGKVCLWPHMQFTDRAGWNIDDLLTVLNLRNNSIMYYNQVAHSQSEMMMVPDNEVATLYQIADVFVLLSGEGFGLPIFEAMASNLPCILLNHSACGELGANGRAHLIDVQDSVTWTGSHLTQRPIPRVNDVVDAMLKIYKDSAYRTKMAIAGREFATQYTWDNVLTEWNDVFMSFEVPFIKPMQMEVVS